MKTIIAGSRHISDPEILKKALKAIDWNITEVVCGMAYGVDRLGHDWAVENGIPVAEFPSDWKRHGRIAGFLRNQDMAEYSQALLAVWDGESRGTKDMIKRAREHGLKVFIYIPNLTSDGLDI